MGSTLSAGQEASRNADSQYPSDGALSQAANAKLRGGVSPVAGAIGWVPPSPHPDRQPARLRRGYSPSVLVVGLPGLEAPCAHVRGGSKKKTKVRTECRSAMKPPPTSTRHCRSPHNDPALTPSVNARTVPAPCIQGIPLRKKPQKKSESHIADTGPQKRRGVFGSKDH